MKRFASLLAAFLAASCTVGPDFVRPDPPKDQSYLSGPPLDQTAAVPDVLGGEAQRFVADLDIPAQWWQLYESRPLNDLVERAFRANPDIQSAIQALKAAQQTARAQRAALFPVVGITGSGSQNSQSQSLSAPTSQNTFIFGLFTGLLNINYLLDLWGGTRRSAESAEAQAEAQCFLLEAAYLTLSSNVVVAAVTEAALRAQIAVTERTIQVQRESLALFERRLAIGQGALADVATQRAALAQSEAALPPLRNQLSQQRHLLAQLTGRTAANLPAETFDLASLRLPQALPVSLPSRMVEQRPDVRSAEAGVHAAGATVGVATAAMLPQVTLSLVYGSTATSSDLLFSPLLGPTLTAGGSLAQTLLDGGALLARRRAAIAAWEQAKAQYRSTVLTAFRNVADSLRALEFDALTLQAASNAENAARLSLQITRRRQVAGDAGVLDILNAELTYQTAASALVSARVARFSDTAGLFQALGGGWWNRDAGGNPDPARRAVCHAPNNPPKPQPWPDARSRPAGDVAPAQPAAVTRPDEQPPSTTPASTPTPKPSKGFWGGRF
ncbi:MAG: efflux transporter outer membrane subunit [Reyranella sp.]|nr:efflux transporter outer membrane subunit [Reyranella sp.]